MHRSQVSPHNTTQKVRTRVHVRISYKPNIAISQMCTKALLLKYTRVPFPTTTNPPRTRVTLYGNNTRSGSFNEVISKCAPAPVCSGGGGRGLRLDDY